MDFAGQALPQMHPEDTSATPMLCPSQEHAVPASETSYALPSFLHVLLNWLGHLSLVQASVLCGKLSESKLQGSPNTSKQTSCMSSLKVRRQNKGLEKQFSFSHCLSCKCSFKALMKLFWALLYSWMEGAGSLNEFAWPICDHEVVTWPMRNNAA